MTQRKRIILAFISKIDELKHPAASSGVSKKIYSRQVSRFAPMDRHGLRPRDDD